MTLEGGAVPGHIGPFDLMHTLSKPSTAKCTLERHTAFLSAEPHSAGCVHLAEVAGGVFAHDAANRFLNREALSGKDLSGPSSARWQINTVRNACSL